MLDCTIYSIKHPKDDLHILLEYFELYVQMHQCVHIQPFLPVSLKDTQLTERTLDDVRALMTSIFA